MGKNSKTKNFCKQKKNNKIIHNSLHLVSPFHFTNRNNFIYNIKLYKEFIKFSNSFNDYKPKNEEILFLKYNIQNANASFSNINIANKSNGISQYFKKIFPYIKKVDEELSDEIKYIKEIMENRDKGSNITIVRIKEILKIKYNINLSNSSIYRIIKNKLKYKFRRTLIKNIDLNKTKYKIMSFIFIKIIIRAMLNNFNFIFIDESNFLLVNNHFRTWVKEKENLHYGPKKKDKINIILAVSVREVVNYKLIKDNINKNNFEDFMKETIELLSEDELKNTLFVMDNLSVHLSKNIKEIMQKNKLKILFTVPYESMFNPIELAFRYIKNIIYRKIYLNIKNMTKEIIDIITSDKIKECLYKNFIETLGKYVQFLEQNIEFNLDSIINNENK